MDLLDPANYELLKNSSAKTLSPEMLRLLELTSQVFYHNRRLKAYSCFDGDDLTDIDIMRMITHKLHFTPLNPEYVLGYYVSVNTLQTKREVMKCCLSIAESCDELWIFSRDEQIYSTLTEGMLAEVMMFRNQQPDHPVRLFDLHKLKQQDYSNQNLLAMKETEISEGISIDDVITQYPLSQRQEIIDGLLEPYFQGDKYPPVYIVAASKDIKHLDWARAFTLKNKHVPINQHAVLGSFLLQIAHNGSRIDMLKDVINIMDMTSEMWIFGTGNNHTLYKSDYPLDVAFELCLWLQHFRDRPIRFIHWSETQVPKYIDCTWALTSKERIVSDPRTNSKKKDDD